MLTKSFDSCRGGIALVGSCFFVWLIAFTAVAGTVGTVMQNVNLREGPGTAYRVLTGINAGTAVDVLQTEDRWVQVSVTKNHIGFKGWIFARYVKTTTVPVMTPAPTKRVSEPAPETRPAPAENPPAAVSEPPTAAIAPQPETVRDSAHAKTPSPEAVDRPPEMAPMQVAGSAGAAAILTFAAAALSVVALIVSWQALRFARRYRQLAKEFERLRCDGGAPVLNIREKRHHPRIHRIVEVDFAVKGRFHRGIIDNISAGGAFIETIETFDAGAAITVSYPAPNEPGQIKREGQITRKTENGIAVAFKNAEDVDENAS